MAKNIGGGVGEPTNEAASDPPKQNGTERSSLIVVGASAGGIDALMTLAASLPADFPAPIVVAQHLDPRRPSLLSELLSARTQLSVVLVNADEPLKPSVIYVVPSAYDVEISDHHVGIARDGTGMSVPSVDRLMTSAARVFGEHLIGVILTGIGMDGAVGAQAIKAYGGTVIVQNPATAQFSGMPSAVPPSVIDIVAELDAIGPLLDDLVNDRYALPPPGQDGELRFFLDRVREQSGIDFGAYKRPTIERRLQRRMAAVGATSIMEYQRHLDRNPEEMQRLVASFLINVTRFFRDAELFTHLRDNVLPAVIAEGKERGELRLWSAGCSTGEEAYTLAMLVAELLRDGLDQLPIRIFATDVAADAVDYARRGLYPEGALADVPPELIERYFVRVDSAYEIRKPVRGLVVFGEHDLGHRAPFPRIDLVLCRNVLIYFTPELQRRALQRFAFSLNSGGYLVLGKAESVSPLPAFFALDHPRLKIFRRNDSIAPVVTDRTLNVALAGASGNRAARRPAIRRLAPTAHPPAPGSSLAEQPAALLDALSLGIVIVDRNYDIRVINVAARRLLGLHGAGLGEDIIHRVPTALAPRLRPAIDTAFRGESTVFTFRRAPDIVDDQGRHLAITVDPVRADDANGLPDGVRIEIADVTPLIAEQEELGRQRAALQQEVELLRKRTAAAVGEVRDLRVANEAMAVEAARLRAENEQLQLAHEEVQAAAEEIETLNEEQQATNEELETLNEELQATVEELNTANTELESRATELEMLATTLEQRQRESELERERLEAILANMSDAVLVIDSEGRTVRLNGAWERLFGPSGEIAAEDEMEQPLPPDAQPMVRATRGETFTATFTLPGEDDSRRWFEASAKSVLGENGIRWGVVVIRDITERSMRRLQEQFLAMAAHELRTPLTALMTTLQLLNRRVTRADAEPSFMELTNRAIDQTWRLEAHIGDLIDVARLQSSRLRLERKPVDLVQVIRAAEATAQSLAADQQFELDLPDEPVMIDGDARRLEQVLLNLLSNALTYASETELIEVRLRREDGQAVIEVQDHGPGIPADDLPNIFARFFHVGEQFTPGHGLGLGLYIAREIVTAHGGTIEAASTVGQGAIFTIRLPIMARAIGG